MDQWSSRGTVENWTEDDKKLFSMFYNFRFYTGKEKTAKKREQVWNAIRTRINKVVWARFTTSIHIFSIKNIIIVTQKATSEIAKLFAQIVLDFLGISKFKFFTQFYKNFFKGKQIFRTT